MSEITSGKPRPVRAALITDLSARHRTFGRTLLLVFAFCFPLATAFDRTESNQVKFYALSVFALMIGCLLFRPLWNRAAFLSDKPARLLAVIWGILSVYAVSLLGATLQAVLFPGVFFVVVLAFACRRQLETILPRRTLILLGLLVAVFFLCSFATTHQYTALGGSYYRKTGLVTLACCVLIFLATVLFLSDTAETERAVKWMLAGSFVITVIGLLQFFLQKGFMSELFKDLRTDPRSMGTIGHPNWFGTYLLLMFPFAVFRFFRDRRFVWGALCCLLYANILTAQTRGAWIGTAAFLAFLFFSRKEHRKDTLRLCALLVIVTAFLAPWNNWQILKRADTLTDEAGKAIEGSSAAGTGRFGFWKYAMKRLPAHAVLGSGPDTLAEITPEGEKAPVDKAHSVYLEYAVTIGIPGLLLYLAFLWKCTTPISASFLHWTFRGLLVAYLTQGLFIHDTIHTWPLVWFIAGLAVVASREPAAT